MIVVRLVDLRFSAMIWVLIQLYSCSFWKRTIILAVCSCIMRVNGDLLRSDHLRLNSLNPKTLPRKDANGEGKRFGGCASIYNGQPPGEIDTKIQCRELSVSHFGQDIPGCGTISLPCRSIRFTVMNISRHGDTIYVNHTQGKAYIECGYSGQNKSPIIINKPLSIIGKNGRPVIRCVRNNQPLFKIQDRHGFKSRVLFDSLEITGAFHAVESSYSDMFMTINNCNFKDNGNHIVILSSGECYFEIFNSRLIKSIFGVATLGCLNLTARIVDTVFIETNVNLMTVKDQNRSCQVLTLTMLRSTFNGNNSADTEYGFSLLFSAKEINITISETRFTNCVGGLLPCFGIYSERDYVSNASVLINLNQNIFENNRAESVGIDIGSLNHLRNIQVSVVNCIFRNNKKTSLRISLGKLGYKRFSGVILKKNTFSKNNYERNDFLSNGLTSAVYLDGGVFLMSSCNFFDNFLGYYSNTGVIFVADWTRVSFEDCYFENGQLIGNAMQIYAQSLSRLEFKRNNTFNITAVKHNQVILLHLPARYKNDDNFKLDLGVYEEIGASLYCPTGYLLHNETYKSVDERYKMLKYLSYSCEHCPQRTYSLERGGTTTNNTQEAKCHRCPRGGECSNGQITARRNFWGYVAQKKVSFLPCPPGYCCNSKDCKSYNSCYGNRSGRLCGRCPDGMSEGLFDTNCRANEECHDYMFWLMAAFLCISYLIFFLYFEEIAYIVRKVFFSKKNCTENNTEGSSNNNSNQQIGFSESVVKRRSNVGGYIKIFFYYYQIVYLFSASADSEGKADNNLLARFKAIFSGIINLVITNYVHVGCPLKDLRPVLKITILHSSGLCVLVLMALTVLFWKGWINTIRVLKKKRNSPLSPATCPHLHEMERVPIVQKNRFSVRVLRAFTQIMLVVYSSSAGLCLNLLHCVPIGENMFLFIDGTLQCYQTFQYFLFAYLFIFVLPFFAVPVLGSYLLKFRLITPLYFCLGCFFPLPFCFYCVYVLIKYRPSRYNVLETNEFELEQEINDQTIKTNAILRVLLGPFKQHSSFLCFPKSQIPWEGALIFRRLVLILASTFCYDNRLRMIILLILCVLILASHLYVQPYTGKMENLFETISLIILTILCGFTLVKALYQGEDYSYSSSSLHLLTTLNITENILILSPIVLIVFVLTCCLLLKLISLIVRFCIKLLCFCAS